jgi:cytochrome b561
LSDSAANTTPSISQPEDVLNRYDQRTIGLHWVVAFLVAALWIAGQCIDLVPRGFPKITLRSFHITFGVVFGFLLIYRIFWRTKRGTQLPPFKTEKIGQAAKYFHSFLYALMLMIFLSGVVAVWYRGVNMFDLFKIPAFDAENKEMRRLLVTIHEWIANAILLSALLHTSVALWHHFKLKDGLLERMWPSKTMRDEKSE